MEMMTRFDTITVNIRGRVLCYSALLLFMVSCVSKDIYKDNTTRTVLVYMAADNSLADNASSNIYSMMYEMKPKMESVNLLVFVDRRYSRPALLHLHDMQIDTVKKYPECNSASADVLAKVIEDVTTNWAAETYGLVLWSHGYGWVPTSKLHYVCANYNYARRRNGYADESLDGWFEMTGTKGFGYESRPNQNPQYTSMELEDMANAIPDNVFDYIVFDACYMGNVEVAYALRNKAHSIVSCACEIPTYGYPYHKITRDLMNRNLINVCQKFHQYYNGFIGWHQMACISLVNTEGLDSLARCFSKIVTHYESSIPDMDVNGIQFFDCYDHHVFYDLQNVVERIDTEKLYIKEFLLQLDRCVPYKINTPYIFPNSVADSRSPQYEIEIKSYCGMSVYIPKREYDAPGLNDEYRKTEWSKNTGY